jgi:hypothetical protein
MREPVLHGTRIQQTRRPHARAGQVDERMALRGGVKKGLAPAYIGQRAGIAERIEIAPIDSPYQGALFPAQNFADVRASKRALYWPRLGNGPPDRL